MLEQAPPIHYVSSERDLVLPPSTVSARAQGLLALGGPAFDATSETLAGNSTSSGTTVSKATVSTRAAGAGCESFQAIRFQPLSGTLQEVREVANLWQQGPSSADAGGSCARGRGRERAHVQAGSAGSPRAAPGDARLLPRGDLFVRPVGTRAVGGLVERRHQARLRLVENPLLLSGLALAGANRRQPPRPGEDDGILTAEEVAALNLGGVEWAVLSACDTGVGESQGRRGRVRPAARVSGRGRADGDHEPLVRGRPGDACSGCARSTKGGCKRASTPRTPCTQASLDGAPGPPGPRPEHAPLLLGGVRRRRRLALTPPVTLSVPSPFSYRRRPHTPGRDGRRPKTRDRWETSSV